MADRFERKENRAKRRGMHDGPLFVFYAEENLLGIRASPKVFTLPLCSLCRISSPERWFHVIRGTLQWYIRDYPRSSFRSLLPGWRRGISWARPHSARLRGLIRENRQAPAVKLVPASCNFFFSLSLFTLHSCQLLHHGFLVPDPQELAILLGQYPLRHHLGQVRIARTSHCDR